MKSKFLIIILTFGFMSISQAEVNVRVDPISPLVGTFGVEVDFPISTAWTIGPALRYINRTDGDFDVSGYGIGLRGNYWFNGSVLTQGWYFGPLLQFIGAKVEDTTDGSKLEGSASGAGVTAFFGYQWMWEQFNINLGAGPSFYSLNTIKVDDGEGNSRNYNGYNSIGIGLEFSLGWKF